MMHKRTIVILLILALVTLVGIGKFVRHTPAAKQTAVHPQRQSLGRLPVVRSDVPEVELKLEGARALDSKVMPMEIAMLRIINHTDQPIDAYRISGGAFAHFSDARETGSGQLLETPIEPLIAPHGEKTLDFELSNVPDNQPIVLEAVAFRDGTVHGNPAGKELLRASRAHVDHEHAK